MNKSLILSILLLLGFLNSEAQKPPNIVYILADDMGIGDISALHTNAKVDTPHIDTLVKNGMTFTDAHTTASVCTPSRYSIMTGEYAWRTKLKARVLDGYSKAMIDSNTDTAPKLLQRNGYNTAMIGKWHLGWNWQMTNDSLEKDDKVPYKFKDNNVSQYVDYTQPFTDGPTAHGFDYFFGINASLDFPPYAFAENNQLLKTPTETMKPDGKRSGFPGGKQKDLEGGQKLKRKGDKAEGFKAEMVMQELTQRSVDYISSYQEEEPFFLYIPLTAPHTPVYPRNEFVGTSQAGRYGDFIHELDWTVGQIVSALKEKGIEDNTIIIFTADNGASKASFPIAFEDKFDHQPSAHLRGRKATLHQGGHTVPFIVQWKHTIQPNTTNNTTVSLADLYATCADLLNVETDNNQAVDSYSMLSLLKGGNEYKRKVSVYTNFAGRFSIRKQDWKMDLNPKKGKSYLFNIKEDPSETNNLFYDKDYTEKKLELTSALNNVILNGRSTDGEILNNEGPEVWKQLFWMKPKTKVFLLAGQSNMDGRAKASGLSELDKKRLKKAQKNVTLYYNFGEGKPLDTTKVAKHTAKKFGAEYLFGPELFFGIEMSEKYPDHNIVLIKRAKGDMSLYGAWNPHWTLEKATLMNEQNQPKLYSEFLDYGQKVLSGLEKDSYELCGMLWVQGESDSGKKGGLKPRETYEVNLTNLISSVRNDFNHPKLPFLLFQVGHGKVVEAMQNVAKADDNVVLIPQEKDKQSKFYFERNPLPIGHYVTSAMKKMGTYFFEYYENEFTQKITQ